MLNDAERLITAFKKLETNNNELVQQANIELSNLLSNSSTILPLFHILDTTNDLFVMKQSLICLKMIIIKFKEKYEFDISNIFHNLLIYLTKIFQNEVMQNILCDILSMLICDDVIPILLSFIQESVDSKNTDLISVCCTILMQVEDLTPFLPLCIEFISNVNNLSALFLGFKIRKYIESNIFEKIFINGIECACDPKLYLNYISLVKIINFINNSIEYIENDHPKIYLIEKFMQMVGNHDIDIKSQTLYASSVSLAIECTNISDINLMMAILLQYIELYSFFPEDESKDIFDFMKEFSKNDEFLKLFLSKFSCFLESEKILAGFILALSYCFENSNFHFINESGLFLGNALQNSSQLIRENAAFAIKSFSIELDGMNEEIYPFLIESILNSLMNIDCNIEVIEAFSTLLSSFDSFSCFGMTFDKNIGSVLNNLFEKAVFSFFIPKIEAKEKLQFIFPAFTLFCSLFKEKCIEHFQRLFDLNLWIINSNDTSFLSIKDFAVDGLKNLVVHCSSIINNSDGKNNFNFHEFINYLLKLLQENLDDEPIKRAIIVAFGSLVAKYSEFFFFPNIIPLFFQLIEIQDELSSLALSTICGIIIEYPNYDYKMYLPNIYKYFFLLKPDDNTDKTTLDFDSILNLIRGMALFVQLPNLNLQTEDLLHIIQWSMSFITKNESLITAYTENEYNELLSESLTILIEIVANNDYQFDYSIIFPAIEELLQHKYSDDLFQSLTYLIKKLISKGVVFDALVPHFFEMTVSESFDIREIGLQILGQIVESKNGKLINHEFIDTLIKAVFDNLERPDNTKSISAVFVINQISTGAPSLIHPYSSQLVQILLNCLNEEENNSHFYAFIDNCVTSFASLIINVIKDELPIERYILKILDHIPAHNATAENFEMMKFFIWMGEKVDFQPFDAFARPLIKLFSFEKDDIGFISEKKEFIEKLKSRLKILLSNIENPSAFCRNILNDNQYRLHCLEMNID